jgi:hypothetical protein
LQGFLSPHYEQGSKPQLFRPSERLVALRAAAQQKMLRKFQ